MQSLALEIVAVSLLCVLVSCFCWPLLLSDGQILASANVILLQVSIEKEKEVLSGDYFLLA